MVNSPDKSFKHILDDEMGLRYNNQQGHVRPAKLKQKGK